MRLRSGTACALAAAGVLLAGCGDDRFTLTGTMLLTGSSRTMPTYEPGQPPCVGTQGYADIAEGAPVTVYDASGTIVATGALGRGATRVDSTCIFPVTVDSVPAGKSYYQVEVSHRGKVTVAEQDARNGKLEATLGSPQ
jgi:hypothetical protein